jgi:large subunit ribosomal protein L2
MGKRIRVQRRGRGSSTFRSLPHKRISPSKYFTLHKTGVNYPLTASVKELLHEPGRGSPLAKIMLENGKVFYIVAPEGISVNQQIEFGPSAHAAIGNILPVSQISPGTLICNLEHHPGDGGKFVKASGTYATVVSHTSKGTLVKLPSKKLTYINDLCLATIGIVSGAGRTSKPFLKAGNKSHWMSAKGRMYPTTKGVAMNACDHPHGGGAHKSHSLRPTTVSRNAPPGAKVGLIAARQTGRARSVRARQRRIS